MKKTIFFQCDPNEKIVKISISKKLDWENGVNADKLENSSIYLAVPITKIKDHRLNFGKISEFQIDVDSLLEKIKQLDG